MPMRNDQAAVVTMSYVELVCVCQGEREGRVRSIKIDATASIKSVNHNIRTYDKSAHQRNQIKSVEKQEE